MMMKNEMRRVFFEELKKGGRDCMTDARWGCTYDEASMQEMSLWDAVGEAVYQELDAEVLVRFLESALKLQTEEGILRMYEDRSMPWDCGFYVTFRVSMSVSAVAVYLLVQHRELLGEDVLQGVKRLLDGTYERGIRGEGYSTHEIREAVMMRLSLAGLKTYHENEKGFSAAFSETTMALCQSYREQVHEYETTGKCHFRGGSFDMTAADARLGQVLAAYDGFPHTVFVYGTLLRGQRAEGYLAGQRYAGRFHLNGYQMYDLGAFPGVRQGKGTVWGEVYFINDSCLEDINGYEDEGRLYHRRKEEVRGVTGHLSASVYVIDEDAFSHFDNRRVMTEPWNASDDDEVWYAGYGSNLDPDRFRLYIQGGRCEANGKTYTGCTDRTLWREEKTKEYSGSVYFGNTSSSWNHKGVAFYQRGKGNTVMHLYKITRKQLKEVQVQEGMSSRWYGELLCLGADEDGCPVYTFTCGIPAEKNAPDENYTSLIQNALVHTCGMTEKGAERYLAAAQRRRPEKDRK